jgi:probable HAF family extracellular repeat protein
VATQLTNPQGIVFSNAASINNLGQIVGVSLSEDFMARAVLWDNGLEIDLNSFLTASEQSEGWVLTYAIDINDSGSIVGGAINTVSNVERGFLLQSALQPQSAFLLQIVSSVPEADTPVMLLIGLGVMGFVVRHRKNTQA